MNRRRSPVSIFCLIIGLQAQPALAGGIGVSSAADGEPTEPVGTVEFHPYKVPENVSAKARRDLEFLWSNTYITRGHPLTAIGPDGKNDLDRFGLTLAEERFANALGFDMTQVQLVFDYLNFGGATYSTNTSNPGFLAPISGASIDDRKHVDTYFYAPNVSAQDPGDAPGLNNRGAFPSDFISPREDISTGHQESLADVVFGNATSFAGPRMDEVGDLSATRWTRPMARTNWTWNHEFQHMINSRLGGGVFTEIWSSIAEALGGEVPDPPRHDVPYTWSLLMGCTAGASGCPRNNYAAWRSFGAYLTYNFRGPDTTLAGRADDLVWRWARAGGAHGFVELGNSLAPGACVECDEKDYFAGMDGHQRLLTLIQNWRVANFVNNPIIHEGQYGFPPQFGFDPARDVGNWQDVDGDEVHNGVALPPDVAATADWRTKEAVFTTRPAGNGFAERPLYLQMFGAEYFIVHADASVLGYGQDLVLRCGSDSAIVERDRNAACILSQRDARMVVSVVAYSTYSSASGQELFRNPGWARWVVTKAVDVDSMAADLEFVIPGFGDSIRAVVVVASMVDGPSRAYSGATAIGGGEALPLRFEFGLRNHPVQSPNPQLVAGTPLWEAAPAWSPDGAFIVYEGTPSAGAPRQIFKVSVGGGQPTLLHPNPTRYQEAPDWSPRGDWVAFVQDQLNGSRNVWLHIASGGSGTTQLTSWNGVAGLPTFQPNGQGLAYVMSQSPENSPWQLRRVDVDGANDVLIKTLTYADGTLMPTPGALRWAPDGSRIFLTVNDTILSVPSGGGALSLASLPRAYGFDLPLGSGAVALAESRRIPWTLWCYAHPDLECCSPFGFSLPEAPYSRVSIVDTTSNTVRSRFFQTGASFSNIRWSWDNTRVAYGSNSNNASDYDVLWGEVTSNRAPHFAGLTDQSFPACQLFNLYVSASDPDGEQVTFSAAYLPPGAQFVPPNRFKWTYPQPGTYYAVFRAKDPSGGVDNRVVRLDVYYDPGICEGGGLLTAGGGENAGEVVLIERNGEETAGGELVRLRHAPAGPNAAPTVTVAPRTAAALVRAPQLLAVDRPSNVEVRSSSGQLVAGWREAMSAVHSMDLESSWEGGVRFGADRALTLAPFLLQGEGPAYLAIEFIGLENDAAASEVRVETLGDGGAWTVVSAVPAGTAVREHLIPIASGASVRLTSDRPNSLLSAGLFHPMPHSVTSTSAPLATAVVTGPLRGDGEALSSAAQPWLIAPGEILTMQYNAPNRVEDTARDWVVALEARSVGSSATEWVAMRPESREDSRPREFALRQNQPNPYAAATTIRFDLPVSAYVELEIFDMQGRRVKTLVGEDRAPGYHAVNWNTRDELGNRVNPGVYLYRIKAGTFASERKMVVKP